MLKPKLITFAIRLSLGVILALWVGMNFNSASLLSLNPPTAIARESISSEAESLLQQGKQLYQSGRYREAVESWQPVARRAGNPLQRAIALNYLALGYQQLGQRHQAREAIDTSLQLIETSNAPQKLSTLAMALNTRGSLEFARGNAEAALGTWERSSAVYARIGDKTGKNGSLINQARAQQALGLFRQARQTLEQVRLSLSQESDPTLKSIQLRTLANLKRSLGELEESQQLLQQSLAAAREARSPEQISATVLELGNTARSRQQPQQALDYYRQAAASSSQTIRWRSQLNQLSLLVATDPDAAIAIAVQLLPQLDRLPPGRSTLYDRIHLTEHLARLAPSSSFSRTDVARIAAATVEQANALGDSHARSYALGHLGGLYERTRQWSHARQLTQQALAIAQSIQAEELSYQWQWQLGRIHQGEGNPSAATAAFQAAILTLDALRQELAAVDPEIQFSFQESVEPVYRGYVDLLLQHEPSASPSQAHLIAARQTMEALRAVELENFFRSACLEGQTVPIDAVDRTATATIYPILLEDRFEVIVSLPERPLSHATSYVTLDEVEQTLEQLRVSLEQPFVAPEGKTQGQRVYDWLIAPLAAQLRDAEVETLVFVLDGALRNLPMAALYDGNHYLVENYSIALAPGLQLLDPQPLGKIASVEALAAGLTQERLGFSALNYVDRELSQLGDRLPVRVLLDQEFTSEALQQQIADEPFPIVHLATHGQFSSMPQETFILAWDKKITVNELSSVLSDRSRPIELLVLSACETAAGDKRAALGLAGMAIQAGTRSTLASLWSLNDESGARFVSQFYEELAAKDITKAEALRRAQIALLQDPDYRQPLYWAPYVLIGNWL